MPRDIEYWQSETEITVEPKTVKGRAMMVEQFPIYGAAKEYKAYLANNGVLRWEFPVRSSSLTQFLDAGLCTVAQAVA